MASLRVCLRVAYTLAMIPSLSAYIAGDADRETIEFVAIIHRHGHSNPTKTYPNDPYIDHKWTGGRGALSPNGSVQMYTLGRTLRRRYYRLLPSDGFYASKSMHVSSSSTERTLMSCQSFLAGFMPPLAVRNPLPIPWQPISIYSNPRHVDNLILQEDPCPKYDKIYSNLLTNASADSQEFYKENAELFDYLTEHSGSNITTVSQAASLYPVLLHQQINHLALPAWTDPVFPNRLLPMVERALELRTHTTYMKRIKGGPLITKIVDQMRMKQNRAAPNRSFSIYCGHETTLASVMRALNVIDQTSRVPAYGASLSIELHCATPYEPVNVCNDVYVDDDYCNDFEVKIVYYSNENDDTPRHVHIPNCPAPCSLDRFIGTIDKILIYDFGDACKSGG